MARNLVMAAWALAHAAGYPGLPGGESPDPEAALRQLVPEGLPLGALIVEARGWDLG